MTPSPLPSSLDSLWCEYAITRSLTLRNRLVEAHLRLAQIIAAQTCRRLPRYVGFDDDVLSDAYLGLIDAVERYVIARKLKFATYAARRIRGAILDGLRRRDFATRDGRRCHSILGEARDCLLGTLGQEPTDEELRDELARRGHDAQRVLANAQHYHEKTSLDVGVGLEDMRHGKLADLFVDPHPVPAQTAENSDDLEQLLSPLNPRERELIHLRHAKGKQIKDIAARWGCSTATVFHVQRNMLQKLKARRQQHGSRID